MNIAKTQSKCNLTISRCAAEVVHNQLVVGLVIPAKRYFDLLLPLLEVYHGASAFVRAQFAFNKFRSIKCGVQWGTQRLSLSSKRIDSAASELFFRGHYCFSGQGKQAATFGSTLKRFSPVYRFKFLQLGQDPVGFP